MRKQGTMDKFKDKYRISSARLEGWNYGNPGLYFITICTKDRIHYFGNIENNTMLLNELGKIVNNEWLKTVDLRPDMNLEMGNFIVMPNHFHAVIFIGDNIYNNVDADEVKKAQSKKTLGPQSKNLSAIVRGFKSAVTQYARISNIKFNWQSSFHDHIIRGYDEFSRISEYIKHNPERWHKDVFNK